MQLHMMRVRVGKAPFRRIVHLYRRNYDVHIARIRPSEHGSHIWCTFLFDYWKPWKRLLEDLSVTPDEGLMRNLESQLRLPARLRIEWFQCNLCIYQWIMK